MRFASALGVLLTNSRAHEAALVRLRRDQDHRTTAVADAQASSRLSTLCAAVAESDSWSLLFAQVDAAMGVVWGDDVRGGLLVVVPRRVALSGGGSAGSSSSGADGDVPGLWGGPGGRWQPLDASTGPPHVAALTGEARTARGDAFDANGRGGFGDDDRGSVAGDTSSGSSSFHGTAITVCYPAAPVVGRAGALPSLAPLLRPARAAAVVQVTRRVADVAGNRTGGDGAAGAGDSSFLHDVAALQFDSGSQIGASHVGGGGGGGGGSGAAAGPASSRARRRAGVRALLAAVSTAVLRLIANTELQVHVETARVALGAQRVLASVAAETTAAGGALTGGRGSALVRWATQTAARVAATVGAHAACTSVTRGTVGGGLEAAMVDGSASSSWLRLDYFLPAAVAARVAAAGTTAVCLLVPVPPSSGLGRGAGGVVAPGAGAGAGVGDGAGPSGMASSGEVGGGGGGMYSTAPQPTGVPSSVSRLLKRVQHVCRASGASLPPSTSVVRYWLLRVGSAGRRGAQTDTEYGGASGSASPSPVAIVEAVVALPPQEAPSPPPVMRPVVDALHPDVTASLAAVADATVASLRRLRAAALRRVASIPAAAAVRARRQADVLARWRASSTEARAARLAAANEELASACREAAASRDGALVGLRLARVVSRVHVALVEARGVRGVMDVLSRVLPPLLGVRSASLWVCRAGAGGVRELWTSMEQAHSGGRHAVVRTPVADTLLGKVVLRRQPLRLQQGDHVAGGAAGGVAQWGVPSTGADGGRGGNGDGDQWGGLLAVPLFSAAAVEDGGGHGDGGSGSGDVVGVVCVHGRPPTEPFDDDDEALLASVCQSTAAALRRCSSDAAARDVVGAVLATTTQATPPGAGAGAVPSRHTRVDSHLVQALWLTAWYRGGFARAAEAVATRVSPGAAVRVYVAGARDDGAGGASYPGRLLDANGSRRRLALVRPGSGELCGGIRFGEGLIGTAAAVADGQVAHGGGDQVVVRVADCGADPGCVPSVDVADYASAAAQAAAVGTRPTSSLLIVPLVAPAGEQHGGHDSESGGSHAVVAAVVLSRDASRPFTADDEACCAQALPECLLWSVAGLCVCVAVCVVGLTCRWRLVSTRFAMAHAHVPAHKLAAAKGLLRLLRRRQAVDRQHMRALASAAFSKWRQTANAASAEDLGAQTRQLRLRMRILVRPPPSLSPTLAWH